MGFFTNLFGKKKGDKPKSPEHAVLVRLKLSNDQYGEEEERVDIHKLAHSLESAINDARAGEYDGDEFGEGGCILYMYGPDADKLYASVETLLRGSPLTKGAKVTLRYGGAGDPSAQEKDFSL